MSPDVGSEVEQVARSARPRLVALLASGTGDLALAEDAVATAFERALTTWAEDGVPRNPEGWLMTVARNHQRDHWKSSATRTGVPWESATDAGLVAASPGEDIDPEAIPDKRLALLFVCAHPSIDPGARTPLMLHSVLGFGAAEIARAYGVSDATMAQRLVRAKRRIKESRIPFIVPGRDVMPKRLPDVLEAVYGCFAIAWRDADGSGPDDADSMAGEALYLAVTLATLLDSEPEAWALGALIALALSRARARQGDYLPLDEQDVDRWDAELIADGEAMLRRAGALRSGRSPGRFQLEAAIQSVHAARRVTGAIDRDALETLSSALVRTAPSAGSWISHAAILGGNGRPEPGLRVLGELGAQVAHADSLQSFHATRARLLGQVGRIPEARDAYERARELSTTADVRDWLGRQAAALPAWDGKAVAD